MFGLIRKDLLILKHKFSKKDIFILLGLIIMTKEGLGELFTVVFFGIGLMIVSGYCNTLAIVDSKSRWNEYELILPVSIKLQILARYIVCIGLLCIVLGIGLITDAIMCITLPKNNINYILFVFFITYVQMIIALPISLKKGGEKSSFALAILIVITSVIIMNINYISKNLFLFLKTISSGKTLSLIFFLIIPIGTIISFVFALRYKSVLD